MTRLQSIIYEKSAKITYQDFKARYLKYIKQGRSKSEAYELTEADHIEVTGHRRYEKRFTFQNVLSRDKRNKIIKD